MSDRLAIFILDLWKNWSILAKNPIFMVLAIWPNENFMLLSLEFRLTSYVMILPCGVFHTLHNHFFVLLGPLITLLVHMDARRYLNIHRTLSKLGQDRPYVLIFSSAPAVNSVFIEAYSFLYILEKPSLFTLCLRKL